MHARAVIPISSRSHPNPSRPSPSHPQRLAHPVPTPQRLAHPVLIPNASPTQSLHPNASPTQSPSPTPRPPSPHPQRLAQVSAKLGGGPSQSAPSKVDCKVPLSEETAPGGLQSIVGLVIGTRGITQKLLEGEAGCTVSVSHTTSQPEPIPTSTPHPYPHLHFLLHPPPLFLTNNLLGRSLPVKNFPSG